MLEGRRIVLGVTGGIAFAAVGFGFRDPQPLTIVYQNLTHQVPCHLQTGPVVKFVG